jgi:hypothetical protein
MATLGHKKVDKTKCKVIGEGRILLYETSLYLHWIDQRL